MEDDDLYDEFGNLIGETSFLKEEVTGESFLERDNEVVDAELDVQEIRDSETLSSSTAIQIYGNYAEVLIETEDTQALDEPLIQVHSERAKGPQNTVFTHLNKNLPKTVYDREYMLELSRLPERNRNVTLVGALNSGKTSLLDLLVVDSHKHLPHLSGNVELGWKQLRYTDNTKLELERGASMKLNGVTILATDLNKKSVVLNLLDAPGHVNFMDQTAVSMSASDCTIICIDVVEGVTSIVENLIKQSQKSLLSMVFVLNKIDRLILELKLPPLDAYLKLTHIVTQLNRFVKGTRISPELGNVVFASSKLGFTFTIEEFVHYFYETRMGASKVHEFVKRLWGDIYFNGGTFSATPSDHSRTNPTFVEFILIPIYKIFTHTLSDERVLLQGFLSRNFSLTLDSKYLTYDPLPLLKLVMKKLFRTQAGLISSLMATNSPVCSNSKKLEHLICGSHDISKTVLLAHALQTIDYGGADWSLVRVYHGEITVGMPLRVLDSNSFSSSESQILDEEEDFPLIKVTDIALLGGRYLLPITRATEGQLVLLKGVSDAFNKSATLYLGKESRPSIFKPINYINEPVFRIVIEPLSPKELPQLLDGLNKISKYYPGVIIKVEESGEHVILGFGELYMDSLLYDLRNNYAGIEIRISNPLTVFSEGCSGESFASIPVTSTDGDISISVGADPMDPKLVEALAKDMIKGVEFQNHAELSKRLRIDYGWDSLSARNLWSFDNCNAFVDDTLPDETDKNLLSKYEQQIKQGFAWAVKEGPLAEEPIHGVRFKLLEVNGIENVKFGGQFIPMVRKACYIAMMTAEPILMEPIYEVDIIFHSVLLPIIEELMRKRRGGRIYKVEKIVGSPLSEARAQLPVIESIGFETDLRLSTSGKAMCQLHFWNRIWRKVPGDVMDEEAPIPKLKPAPINSLSRDFVMKTRRRKGLSNEGYMSSDGPSLVKYVEPEFFKQLKENGLIR